MCKRCIPPTLQATMKPRSGGDEARSLYTTAWTVEAVDDFRAVAREKLSVRLSAQTDQRMPDSYLQRA